MKNENDRQLDRDILESKKDILRARQQNSESKPAQEQAPSKKPHPAESQISPNNQDNSTNTTDIPEFSLANQMMAEHRKSVAKKRKAPGSQTQPAHSEPSRIKITTRKLKHPPETRPENRIISEIVARDIEKIYRGEKTS